MVNEEKGIFGMVDLMRAAAEVLGNGSFGSAYKAVMGTGVAVVVKRMTEMNRIGKEGFDFELRRLGNLQHPKNVLGSLHFFFSLFFPAFFIFYFLFFCFMIYLCWHVPHPSHSTPKQNMNSYRYEKIQILSF